MHPQLAKLFSGALELWLESRRKTHSPFFQVNICSNEVAWAFCIYTYVLIRYICICIIIFVFNLLSWIFAAFRCIASSIWEIVGASQQLNQPLTQRFRRFRWFCLRKMRMIWIHIVEGFSAAQVEKWFKNKTSKILVSLSIHMLFVSNFVTVKMKQDFVQQKTLDPHSFQADTDAETKLSCSAR